ncbi:MAG: alpha/beta hydrolase [Candidatus Gastranaerophilales bacterium]|nr:alpha/beta hydrolase [Candidatus Gastranaerophilales bacterium]
MNMKNTIILILILAVGICFCADIAFAQSKKRTTRILEIQTGDELIISSKLTLPASATSKNKVPLVVFLHSLGGDISVYDVMAEELKAKNIASLAVISRGHSQSLTYMSGKKSYWQNFSNKQFARYPSDIITCIDFIKQNYVSIDVNKIAIVGSDINANAAILAAVKGGKSNIKTLVLFNPSISFKGLEIRHSLVKYGNKPIMIIAGKKDKIHHSAAMELYKYAQGHVELVILDNSSTGDNIIKTNIAVRNKVISWLVTYLK